MSVDFEHNPTHFLGMKMETTKYENGSILVFLSQEAAIKALIEELQLLDANNNTMPYRNGYPVDNVPPNTMLPHHKLQAAQEKLRSIVGSLNWLSCGTRIDVATITNITPSHVSAAKYVVKYLKGSKDLGIQFTKQPNSQISAFLNFPLEPSKITALADANWGPQDASAPTKATQHQETQLFTSRSISGFILWLNGPLHWSSKRQSFTARSSVEAKIYATEECVKALQYLSNILDDLHLREKIMGSTTPIFNDNQACVNWAKNMTSKGLYHVQMHKNAVREAVQSNFASITHIGGKINLADILTKEDKDKKHFLQIHDFLMSSPTQPKMGVACCCVIPAGKIMSTTNHQDTTEQEKEPITSDTTYPRGVCDVTGSETAVRIIEHNS